MESRYTDMWFAIMAWITENSSVLMRHWLHSRALQSEPDYTIRINEALEDFNDYKRVGFKVFYALYSLDNNLVDSAITSPVKQVKSLLKVLSNKLYSTHSLAQFFNIHLMVSCFSLFKMDQFVFCHPVGGVRLTDTKRLFSLKSHILIILMRFFLSC